MHIILNAVLQALRVIEIAIIARCILSFIPGIRNNKIVNIIYWLTEPVLSPARSLLGKFKAGESLPVDLSPVLTFFAIIILRIIIQGFMFR